MKFTAFHNGTQVATFNTMAEAFEFIAKQPDREAWSLNADINVRHSTPI